MTKPGPLNPLSLQLLRNLDVSAASGLLILGESFCVVADDELSLSVYGLAGAGPGLKIPLLPGALPEAERERKQAKPDWESLVYVPSLDAILVVPSGSKPNRVFGALVRGGDVRKMDFSGLYEELWSLNPDLNIEGTVIAGGHLKLFHRGNGPSQKNQIFNLDLTTALQDLEGPGALSARSFMSTDRVDLGMIQGRRLCFTDAAVESPERIWFLAAAESGTSTYEDGAFGGAVLGCLDSRNRVLFQQELVISVKPEGLALDLARRKFYVVTDGDDRAQPAQLLVGDLPDSI
jgi:hypothetical protein